MGGSVIDELIIRLSLDPSDFTKGEKDAAQALLKFKDKGVKATSDLEIAAKAGANACVRRGLEIRSGHDW